MNKEPGIEPESEKLPGAGSTMTSIQDCAKLRRCRSCYGKRMTKRGDQGKFPNLHLGGRSMWNVGKVSVACRFVV